METGYTELTIYTLGSLLHVSWPVWSPAEDTIVFNGWWNEPPDGNFRHITKINSDGSSLEKLEEYRDSDTSDDSGPVWSPDGVKIAWATARSGNDEIWIMNADGSEKEQFTFNPYRDGFPEFSPDGKRLLFSSKRYTGSQGSMDLCTKPLDDSDSIRCLYKGGVLGVPSPDGRRILLRTGQVIDLFVSLTKGTIEGRVLDRETLEPIENATVYLNQGVLIGMTQTNEQGGYQFCNLEPGEYVVNAEEEGYVESDGVAAQTYAWVVSRDTDIELQCVPSVDISEISDGEIIGSVIAINTKREEGNVAYVKYQYKKEGGDWEDIETRVYPYPAVFDTKEPNLSSGNYQIQAIALDSSGNSDSSPDTVAIEIDHTPPVATITSPINGTVFTGTVGIAASSSDADIDSVVFQYKKKEDVLWINVGSVDSEEPWVRQWKTDNLIEGEYELRAVAIDKLGNSDDSPQIVTVTVKSNPSDSNDDDRVDYNDLAELVGYWLGNEPSVDIAPAGGDGRINFLDVAKFA